MATEIGSMLRVTLASGVAVEGCLFSVDEKECTMILMEAPKPAATSNAPFANPNVHVINGTFVSKIEAISSEGSRLMPLPRSVLGDSLPAAEHGDLKKLMHKLKAETRKRTNLYHESASIDACDTFEYFFKTNPDLKWSTEPAHLAAATKEAGGTEVKLVLVLSGTVLLSGNADQDGHSWRHPKIIALSGDSSHLVQRLTKQAEACAARTTL